MRKIEYIFIDSDCPNDNGKSRHHTVSLFRHHFIINKEGLVIKGRSSEHNTSSLEYCRVATELGIANPIDISSTVNLIEGPIYDRDKYNKCSISIRYCGSLELGTLNVELKAKLIRLLVDLRSRFPDAKILGVSELDGKELYSKNIIVSDSMNVLRRELSDYA